MSDINNLITPCNIQGELIKNKIEQNNLMFEAFKEQKYNELLKENQKLKIEISARETVCDELQNRINKAVEHISNEFLCYDNESDEYIQGLKTIDLLKGDKE